MRLFFIKNLLKCTFVVIGIFLSKTAVANTPLSELPQDITTKGGLWIGTVSTADKINYDLALASVAFANPKDISENWERQYQFEVWLNPESRQIVKQSIEANYNLCILGGTRRYTRAFKEAVVVQVNHRCLGALGRIGLAFYDIPAPEGAVAPITGSSVEGIVGFRYSETLFENGDFGFEYGYHLFSITASREQVVAEGSGFSLSLRILI